MALLEWVQSTVTVRLKADVSAHTSGPILYRVLHHRHSGTFRRSRASQAIENRPSAKAQSHGADDGVDVWLYSRSHPGAPVSIVQCKHWSGKRVGVDKLRELRGVMASKDVRRGQFATTSTFTPEATAFARDNGINPLDVDGLLALIAKRTPEQQEALLNVATQGDYW
jgi:restriction endonuclease Mrr